MRRRSLVDASRGNGRRMASMPAVLGLVVVAVSVAALPSALARSADDDLSLLIFLRQGVGVTKTTGLEFGINAEIEGSTGVAHPVTLRLVLPAGLRWGKSAPASTDGCIGDASVVCTGPLAPDSAGTVRAAWRWDVVATAPGSYEITGTASSNEPDPNSANNSSTLQFEVVQPTSGGGSGGGGTAAVKAGAVKLAPAKPKAGSRVVASVRVTRGGSPVRPSGIACAASVGRAKVKSKGKGTSGFASCIFTTPKTAKRKNLAGSISFRAGGRSFSKRFSTRLR
jgi:hypothetical protein